MSPDPVRAAAAATCSGCGRCDNRCATPADAPRCFLHEGNLLEADELLDKFRRGPVADWLRSAQPGQREHGYLCLNGTARQRRSDDEFIDKLAIAMLVHRQDVLLDTPGLVIRHFRRYESYRMQGGDGLVERPGIYRLIFEPLHNLRAGPSSSSSPSGPDYHWDFLCTIDDADEVLRPLVGPIDALGRMTVLTQLTAERTIDPHRRLSAEKAFLERMGAADVPTAVRGRRKRRKAAAHD